MSLMLSSCSPPGDPELNVQETPQESSRVLRAAPPPHRRPGRGVAEVLQENFVTVPTPSTLRCGPASVPLCRSGPAGVSRLGFTCRFLSISQLVSKSSSSSPKGLMSCSATCTGRNASQRLSWSYLPLSLHGEVGCPFNLLLLPKRDGLMEAWQGDIATQRPLAHTALDHHCRQSVAHCLSFSPN